MDAAFPGRRKDSDGWIGDTAHQAQGSASEHNPQHPAPPGNPDYQVDAVDVTHDPDHGCDMGIITEAVRLSRDRRVLYVIFNRRIFSGPEVPSPFRWRDYDGDNPHTDHGHFSVRDATHDQTQDWSLTVNIFRIFGDGVALIHRIWAMFSNSNAKYTLPNGEVRTETNNLAAALARIEAKVDALGVKDPAP